MAGLPTLVTMRVGSVTSTCLRSSLGDMTTFSGPMLMPSSSGILPGQTSRISGSSALAWANEHKKTRHTTEMRILVHPSAAAPQCRLSLCERTRSWARLAGINHNLLTGDLGGRQRLAYPLHSLVADLRTVDSHRFQVGQDNHMLHGGISHFPQAADR